MIGDTAGGGGARRLMTAVPDEPGRPPVTGAEQPGSALVSEIVRMLHRRGAWCLAVNVEPRQRRGVPRILACYSGRFLAIEVKADMPFDKIMNETPREFYSGQVGLKYAQAWSMIHFFYEYGKGKYKALIEEYFEALRAGRTPREAFDSVFKAKADTLQKEWRDFTKTLKL